MSGDVKITRIKNRHATEFALLGDATKMAQTSIPLLRETAKSRQETRDMTDVLSTLGKHVRANGFDPTRKFQHVANFDTPIWTLILDMFARYDPETGELMDDGLLYKTIEGRLQLNKDFFYALVSYFEAQGIECDMRGRIVLN